MDYAGERDDRHLACAAADIDNHRTRRLADRKSDADRRGHRLLNEEDIPRTSRVRRILDRALLDLGDARRHGDDHARLRVLRPEALRTNLVDEVGKHRLGDVEVGYDARLHRTNRDDVPRSPAEHPLRFLAYGKDTLRAGLDGDDRGFTENNSAVLGIDERVRRAEVDADVCREERL